MPPLTPIVAPHVQSRTSMFQIPMTNEDGICRNGEEFEIHQVGSHPLLICWHVEIIMRTTCSLQNRKLSSSYNEENPRSSFTRMVNVILSTRRRKVLTVH